MTKNCEKCGAEFQVFTKVAFTIKKFCSANFGKGYIKQKDRKRNQKTFILNFHSGRMEIGLLVLDLIFLIIQILFTFTAIIVEKTELNYGMITWCVPMNLLRNIPYLP